MSQFNPVVVLGYSMVRIAHSSMAADEVTENIVAAVKTVVDKIRMVSLFSQRAVLGFHQGRASRLDVKD